MNKDTSGNTPAQAKNPVRIATLEKAQLEAMSDLERVAWPTDVQASPEQLRERLEVFPQGCFGAWIGSRLVGMATSQIVRLDRERPPLSWSELCADGSIKKTHDPNGNCLHFVSICVHPEYRNHRVGRALNLARLELARSMGLAFALTDTRIPGLARFLADFPDANPGTYIERILERNVLEPVVFMYLDLGFRPLKLISSCMTSDRESAGYGLAMIAEFNES